MAQNDGTKPGSLSQMRKLQAKNDNKDSSGARQPKQRRPNYHQIHSKPLPLTVYPFPGFVPHNPLSYLCIAYTLATHYLFPPSSHAQLFDGYFDSATRSVHVTDHKSVRGLWESGFFGKGSLSRSEPSWLDQEKKRLGLLATSTSEEVTEKRRKEREWMKRERARIEQEMILAQIKKEQASTQDSLLRNTGSEADFSANCPADDQDLSASLASITLPTKDRHIVSIIAEHETAPVDQEHLQLALEEAFFLIHGLGVLRLKNTTPPSEILTLFRRHSYFPAQNESELSSDDPFLVSYAVYHHFRSLGWVIREGVKFAVDYLLYESGPVFKHAAFAVMIVPSYSHDYWKSAAPTMTTVQRRKGVKHWTWLHCVNRVQTQVLKTLVLCYVDIPPPHAVHGHDIGNILRQYRIREFCISRWSANRNRD